MSKYTTELRYIVENEKLFPPSTGVLSLKSVLENYPLYVESYKDVTSGLTINRRNELNEKIINHYYFREIGFETVNMFLFRLQSKMNNIMKYYNQMYKSVDYEFNPLWNVDMTETFEHTIDGTGKTISTGTTDNTGTIGNVASTDNTGTNTSTNVTDNTGTIGNVSNTDNSGTNTTVNNSDGTSTGENLSVESDTPQSGVTEVDIKANTYASKTNYSKGSSTSSNDVTNTETIDTNVSTTNTQTLDTNVSTTNTETLNTNVATTNTETLDTNISTSGEVNTTDSKSESFTRKEFGSSKGYTFAQNIDQWRNIMINVDLQIVEELNDLFMNVW